MEVVKKEDSLKKISFLSHSLGGLIARYAIAVLYTPNGFSDDTATNSGTPSSSNGGLIAGLEAINFITLATPHLGVRGKKQVYFADGKINLYIFIFILFVLKQNKWLISGNQSCLIEVLYCWLNACHS